MGFCIDSRASGSLNDETQEQGYQNLASHMQVLGNSATCNSLAHDYQKIKE